MSKKAVHKKPLQQTPFYYKYPAWVFVLLVLICYLPVLKLGVTQLDDTVFINDKHDFISKFSNIGAAFKQGCFNEQDIYYRPMLLVYFILLYPFSSPKSVLIFHLGSVFFHALNVWLVYRLLNKLTSNRVHCFWLSVIFAVHPAFTMAVAWIPGINDLLLTTFALGYLITMLNLSKSFSLINVAGNFIFLLLALFTKETGAFLPAGALLLLIYAHNESTKKIKPHYFLVAGLNVLAWSVWFAARKNVLPSDSPALIDSQMVALLMHRAAGLLQYFGKCLLPFNLNVFPTIESTSLALGILSVIAVGALLYFNKQKSVRAMLIGIGWFVLFLLPIFFVPKNISNQLYEHRLYLPMIGVLLVINETVLFSALIKPITQKIVLVSFLCTSVGIIYNYTPVFNDTFSFWNNAVESSPKSAYANKLLGIKLYENNREKESLPFIKTAYELDSTERYTRLFIARLIHIPNQQWDSARWYLENEIKINPKFPDTFAELAHVCVELKDFSAAETYILKFLEFNPKDQALNNNLLLIYNDQKKFDIALKHANNMRTNGLLVNEDLYKAIFDSANAIAQPIQ